LQRFREQLEQVDVDALEGMERLEHDLIAADLSNRLYELQDLKPYEWNPLAYLQSADVSAYIKRSYAPLPERVRAMTRALSALPEFLSAAFANLRADLPRVPLETAVVAFEGQVAYLGTEVREAVAGLDDRAVLAAFEEARQTAVTALQDFIARLRERAATASGEFAIGRASYETMLRAGELVDLPLERVLAVGEENLRHNEELLVEAIHRIAPGGDVDATMRGLSREHPTADALVPETTRVLEELRAYLIEHDIVGVPSEVRCMVQETPPFLRWATAMMDAPGPFERTATEAYYYVTPVERHWTPEQQEEWLSLFDYATIKNVSIHEAYPGHYLHSLHLRNVPSDVARALWSYACVEGWAHYCEQMMQEEGYGGADLRLLIAQLKDALLRNCRYIVSIKMHTQGMTVDEATRFFMAHAHLAELPARKEAARGTFDPGYLNYTLGKLLFLKLRADYRREQGAGFSLREFHDRCLAFGAPPVPLLRKHLLREDVDTLL
jgi:uncharacterized protein (DUF885 family)